MRAPPHTLLPGAGRTGCPALLVATLLLGGALALTACGSTSSSGSSTTTGARPGAQQPARASGPAEGAGPGSGPSAREVRRAGRAAPFLEPDRDNSIPTFGAESSGRRRQAAEAALHSYLTARAAGAWATACKGLAASVRKQTEELGGREGCAAAYRRLSGAQPGTRADPLTGPLLALRVKGRRGFALWIGPHRQKYVASLILEGGRWRIAELAPVPYPLGSPAAP